MRKIYFILLLLGSCLSVSAKHITGGEVTYDYIGPGSTAGSKKYTVTLLLFRDENCMNCADMPVNVTMGVYNTASGSRLFYKSTGLDHVETLPLNALPPCIVNPPDLNYKVGYYIIEVELPSSPAGYTIAYQTCCRIDGIMNVPNQVGATYIASIPGSAITDPDSSPRFAKGISVVCYNKPFKLDFSATDPNPEDSLVYSLCGAYDGGAATSATFNTPSAPPYNVLNYINGYTGTNPLGPLAYIDPATGIISGIAPDAGKYVVSVCVNAYRRGQFVSTHRKDFIITVAPCDFAGSQLKPSYTSCDGYTLNFENLNTSPLNVTFYWEFGDGSSSTEQAPVHTYADTGVYTLKLVVNRGDNCSDSTTSIVRVFPGYFPDFTDNAPMCKGLPVSFRDGTRATYGVVNSWSWDFGVASVANDTSHVQHPVYTYTEPGDYQAVLIVASSKGCIDTIFKNIKIVEKPVFNVTNDTLICTVDTIQLRATSAAQGSATWSPNYMISNVNSFTPLVSPNVTTTYYVRFSDSFGCSATDSVKVKVVSNVTLFANGDTTICRSDEIPLHITSDALYYTWSPAATLNDASVKEPVATPTAAFTNYHVVARISNKCFKETDIRVKTVPYPVAFAGKDTSICFGTSASLHATGGSSYTWTPSSYLTNPNIANPVSQLPKSTLSYIVTVRDTLGCPKPVSDTMKLEVIKIIADAGPKDTSVVLTQPLQLNATGSNHYVWTPSRWLNDANISNPIALPEDNIQYVVKVSNDIGCFGYDSINVKLYKVDPNLYVPTAFSPDENGTNDVFRPIPIGMKSLESFLVYNRWGQLMFSTTQMNKGWDGKFKGAPQGAGTYVWYAEGTDYLGRKKTKKGSVILIR